MTAKPVIPTRLAKQDVEDELTHYFVAEGSEKAALGFIAEIEQAYTHLAKHPNIGLSPLRVRAGHPKPALMVSRSLPASDLLH
ncbi:MAG TPA: type II toxin-antitoxin system RelE/ParE family toxin [Paraburkholderia sp.]|uniref:type II toxin-antitoxin system RelE/ParE family toxin n=1 Tax=Paraburkholderia sp. TaxID=1926495 RepID=UPI002BEAAF02|nr:type II toxin-antitoxin system RelE/ParE family toxin [Paraburkholderia sp.]HTR08730.1 type II toxin-antitoxin system RelE/ParE family toxin [Paraburkholderia sp.]